jgi:hypothetical protein
MNSSLFDGLVDERECCGKEFFRLFFIFVFDGLSDLLYLAAKSGLIFLVGGGSTKTASPLADGGFVVSHGILLNEGDIIGYPASKVKATAWISSKDVE